MKNGNISQRIYIKKLVNKYHYTKLPKELSNFSRNLYEKYIRLIGIPVGECNIDIYSKTGILISHGYERVVIGDYGAYLEISSMRIVRDNLVKDVVQDRRLKRGYKYHAKYMYYYTYDWLLKIPLQLRKVSYADYHPGYFYVLPDDVIFKEDA